MSRKSVVHVCVLLLLSLLAACQSENIPLAAPTPRPSSIVTPLNTPTPHPSGIIPLTNTPSPVSPTPEPDLLAKLVNLQGAGRWRASNAADWDPANIGQTLGVKNQILTESGAKAVVEYLNGPLVYMAPKTLFTVTELLQSEDHTLLATIRLLIGQVFVSHDGAQSSQIRIETDAGIAGVRGTMISVKVTLSGQEVVTCLEGICTLENEHGSIILDAGQQAEILNATTPPVFLGPIADYQLNEWFANHPAALLVALNSGLLSQLPVGCTLEDSLSCQITLDCNPDTGLGCPLPANCNRASGEGCELPGGCNLVTGQGCEVAPGCNPLNGAGCLLRTGCNLVTGQGCAPPLNCDPLSGSGCTPGTGCDPTSGQGCELASGCNPVTGEGCVYTGTFIPTGGQPAATTIPTAVPSLPLIEIPTEIPAEIPTLPPVPHFP